MAPKDFDQSRARASELAQLLILYSIFSLRGSENITFQGGSAIRWVYAGLRFSEDLDFVVQKGIDREVITNMLKRAAREIRNNLIANFGTGEFSISEKASRDSAYKAFVTFKPNGRREKIAVKVEFEKLKQDVSIKQKKVFLGSLPIVSYLIQQRALKVPIVGGVVNIETEEELLSDKIRALLERPYIKGRDLFDLWFLVETLNTKLDKDIIVKKLEAYETPFTPLRQVEFFAHLNHDTPEYRGIIEEVERDLGRFLMPEPLQVLRETKFKDIIMSVRMVFSRILEEKMINQTQD